MSMPVFNIEVDQPRSVELIIDHSHAHGATDLLEPALLALSNHIRTQPFLADLFRLLITADGSASFDSTRTSWEALHRQHLNGAHSAPVTGQPADSASSDGLRIIVAQADSIPTPPADGGTWPVLLWIIGDGADNHYLAAHTAWAANRTVSDPSASPNRLRDVCVRFLQDVVLTDTGDAHGWVSDGMGSLLSGLGYAAQ
ncbi:hypothetical protein R1X32_00550 (plasmid) [Rhodococcus opacus]|uniref:hypothetical protein n=1 Tax=Rhodococcus opacus TaxID=37919 RepID=UPI0034D35D7D